MVIAISGLWGCSDDRCKIIQGFIAENNLHGCLLNSNQHIYLYHASGSLTAIYLHFVNLPFTLIMSGKCVRILMEVIMFLLSCVKLKDLIMTKFQTGISSKLTGKY